MFLMKILNFFIGFTIKRFSIFYHFYQFLYYSFPSQPMIRDRGKYEADRTTSITEDSCTKVYSRYKKLTAGIFTILCPHGIYNMILIVSSLLLLN